MKITSSPDPPKAAGPFLTMLRERKIIQATAGFVGGGVVLVEFAHHILVNHYHLPHQLVDITLISLITAWISIITWRWFLPDKKTARIRKVRWELILVPVFLVVGISLDALQIRHMIRGKPEALQESSWENSIAVLPFENIGGGDEQEYFCDGLTEELINALSNIEELKVVARTSVFAYKGKMDDIRKIGRELNVENVLEGTVRKSGNQIRITAQLIDVADGFNLWSNRFDRELNNVFEIQDEIALAVVDHLRINFLEDVKPRMIKRKTENSEAYDLFLQARFAMNQKTEEGLREAIQLYEQALEIDPGFALAYVGISDAYWDLSIFSSVPASQVYAEAKASAMKAMKIDDSLAEAHAALADIKIYERDWAGAGMEFERALDLNPGLAYVRNFYGYHLMCMGRFDRAIYELKRAIELDPQGMSNVRSLGRIFYCAGRYDEAKDILEEALDINPNIPFTHFILGLVYLKMEMYPEALTVLEKEKVLSAERSPIVDCVMGIVLQEMSELEKARSVFENLNSLTRESSISPYWLAALAFSLGEKERGYGLLERAYTDRDVWLREINVDPLFAAVRKDPQFQGLIERLGL